MVRIIILKYLFATFLKTLFFVNIKLVVSIAEISAEKTKTSPSGDNKDVEKSEADAIDSRLAKLAIVLKTLGSQKEYYDLLKSIEKLIQDFSKDRLESALPPKTVVAQKGRPKSTKREKLGNEHEDA